MYKAGDYERALRLFANSLELPGTGIKRFSNKPPLPSGTEKMASFYNIACCHSRLGGTGGS